MRPRGSIFLPRPIFSSPCAATRSFGLRDTDETMSGGPTTATALELTRRAFASASGGDFEGLSEYLTPDSIFDASPWGLGTYTGPAAIRRFLEDWIGSFDEYE